MQSKNLFLILNFLLIPFFSSAQNIEVTYDNISYDGAVKSEAYLLVGEDRAQYIRDFDGQTVEVDGVTITQQPDYYVNNMYPKTKSYKEFKTLNNQVFVAEWDYDEDWTVSGEEDTILGYTVTKAHKADKPNFSVWFTTDIPISAGPLWYSGVPGLILKIEWEKDDLQVVATKIEETTKKFKEFDESKAIPIAQKNIIFLDKKLAKKLIKQNK